MKNVRGLAVIVLLMCMLLSGCQIGDKSIVLLKPLSDKHVFQLGDVTCSVKEAKVYLVNYQNLYGEAYTLNLWEHDFGDESLETYIKNVTLNKLVTVACMSQLAEQREIMLTEEDKTNIETAAKTYYQSLTKEEKDYLGVSEGDISEYYKRYALAQKVYDSLTDEISDEVSDDEARVMEVMQIYVTDKAVAEDVQTRLLNGEDFAGVAKLYNERSEIQTYICRADIPDEAEAVIFQLEENEVSNALQLEGGYYFVKCLDKYQEELTEENKITIAQKREKEALDSVYNEFIAGLTSYLNTEVWEGLKVERTTEIKTDSFFETYDNL